MIERVVKFATNFRNLCREKNDFPRGRGPANRYTVNPR